ncbi:hypothetical protein [Bradyrhizobium lablabi]|uniref:hypothetical protein n=1 Tax=Bradyrhizobium lablabi TaxID=722472 RepID=UPI001BAD7C74|nr:hypothetical protein [Bradyrhizobium lablabi]MBR0698104.1 hypothetical protein [Bradyrhizobium lablabi]
MSSKFLVGAAAIAEHLRSKGMDVKDPDVYYLHQSQKLPIGKLGKNLISSEEQLDRVLKRAAQPSAENSA